MNDNENRNNRIIIEATPEMLAHIMKRLSIIAGLKALLYYIMLELLSHTWITRYIVNAFIDLTTTGTVSLLNLLAITVLFYIVSVGFLYMLRNVIDCLGGVAQLLLSPEDTLSILYYMSLCHNAISCILFALFRTLKVALIAELVIYLLPLEMLSI